MYKIEQITVTSLSTTTVAEKAGRIFKNENRPTYAISFCKNGKITYRHNGKQYISQPNNAVIIPRGASYELYQNEDGVFPVINFICTEQFTDDFIVIPLGNTKKYLDEYKEIRQLEASPYSRLKMMSAFYTMLEQLVNEPKINNPHLTYAIRYINENIDDTSLSNVTISQEIGISEVYFRKLFKENYSISPQQYIIEARNKKSSQLLRETTMTVSDIAACCGFSGVYCFCRAFKQYFGLTPTEYRQRYKYIKA